MSRTTLIIEKRAQSGMNILGLNKRGCASKAAELLRTLRSDYAVSEIINKLFKLGLLANVLLEMF